MNEAARPLTDAERRQLRVLMRAQAAVHARKRGEREAMDMKHRPTQRSAEEEQR